MAESAPVSVPPAPVIQGIHPKVFNAAAAGALVSILIWAVSAALAAYAPKLVIPPEIASQFTVVVGAIVGYMTASPA